MKEVLISFVIISSVLINSFEGFSQANLVPNGDFEDGGSPICTYNYYNEYEIDNWKMSLGSFDWFDWDWRLVNNCLPTSTIHYPSTTLSNRCVGIYGENGYITNYDYDQGDHDLGYANESIMTKLNSPLNAGSIYKISMDVCLMETSPIIAEDVTLNVLFSTTDEYYSHNNFSINNEVKEKLSFEISKNSIDTWVHLESSFTISNEFDGILEYIIIQGSDEGNHNSYIYIDNVSLISSCESSCIPQILYDPISFTSGSAPTDHNVCHVNNTPYYFLVENATNIWFTVFDRVGGELYSVHQHDPMGLIDAGYSDFMFIWNGYSNNFNVPTGDWPFPYILTVSNCRYTYSIIQEDNQLIFVFPDNNNPPIIVSPVQEYYFPTDCCIPYACFENTNFTGFFREDVYDYIIAGESVCSNGSGPVIISSGAEVIFNAENEVILKPGFNVEEGAIFNAKITPCSVSTPNRSSRYRSEFRDKIDLFNQNNGNILPLFEVFPSIINDKATTRFELDKVMNVKIYIKNSFGETVQYLVSDIFEAGEYSIPFTASSLVSGIYFCVFETNQNIITKKIIIAH